MRSVQVRRNQDPPAIGSGLPFSLPISKFASDCGDKYVRLQRGGVQEGGVPPPAQSKEPKYSSKKEWIFLKTLQ